MNRWSCQHKPVTAPVIRKSVWLFLMLALGILPLTAQKQSNIWYFGRNAGLDFSNFDPLPLTDGQTNSIGGVASICDSTGQLVFYTDGQSIWNSNHILVKNDMSGGSESSQSATIVPNPDVEGQYYVFTTRPFITGSEENYAGNYYTIQINAGGAGQIVYDFSAATGKKGLLSEATEKFLAVPFTYGIDNKTGYWFLMHEMNSNRFLKVRLDSVWHNPIDQFIGSIHQNDSLDNDENAGAIGQMKVNDQGNRIALAVMGGKYFELFNFSTVSGELSRPLQIPAGDQSDPYGYRHEAYGVEFSPTGSFTLGTDTHGNYLYGSARDGSFIYQWDLAESNNRDQFLKSCRFVHSDPDLQCGALQLGPNGKIYNAFIDQDFLGVINSPMSPFPDCNYSKYGARLIDNDTGAGGTCRYGLPNTLPILKSPEPFYFENLCLGDVTKFVITNQNAISINTPKSWLISKLDGSERPVNRISTAYELEYSFLSAGRYRVVLRVLLLGNSIPQNFTREITINPLPVVRLAPKDTVPLCRGSYLTLDAGNWAFYEWEDADIRERSRIITTDSLLPIELYRVMVTDYHGCEGWDTVIVEKKIPPTIASKSSIRAFCGQQDGSATIIPGGEINRYDYVWEGYPNDKSHILDSINGGDYVVHVISKSNLCEIIDTVHVDELGGSSVVLNYHDSIICPNRRITVSVEGASEFEWIRPAGLTGNSIEMVLDTTTIFEIKAISRDEGRECPTTLIDTIKVHPINKPDIGPDSTACEGDTIRINGGEDYAGWTWSDGFEGQVNPVTADADPLVLFATDSNGCTFTDSLKVHFKPVPAIGLGPDRTLCSNSPVTLSGDSGGGDAYQWSTGETSEEIAVSRNDQYWLKITKDGCNAYDTVNIRINNPDKLFIDSVNVRDITCFGNANGEIRIYASGDGQSWQYSIDNGTTFQDSLLFTNLPPHDNYRITVWEDSACRVSRENPVTINEPALLSTGTCVNPPSCDTCSDGNITISTIMGGTPPYKVRINNEETGSEIQGLGPGLYTVTITDANGCSWNSAINLVAGMNVRIEASETGPLCPGSPVTLKVVNGGRVDWINPHGFSSDFVSVNPVETTVYQAESTNDLGCSIIVNYTVTIIPHTDPSLGEDVYKCEGDIVTLDAGDGYLGYSWNTGETSRSINLAASKNPVIVTVTDINQCTLSDTVAVHINPYPEVELGKDKSLCTNTPIGLSGGTGEIYLWNTGATTQTIQVDRSGTYSLIITTLGCSSEDSVEVTIVNPDNLIIDPPLITDNTCFGSDRGAIEIVAHGSGAALEYSIDGGINWQDSSLFEFLPAGDDYRIRVRENQLCTGVYPDPVSVEQPDSIFPESRLKSPTCLDCSDGQIIIKDITGGRAPYLVTLNGVVQEMIITGLAVGDYTVVITDSLGCSRSFDFKIDMNNIIPNVITPNGRDANEKWEIPLLKYYPDAEVRIFDMYGKLIRSFDPGYPDPWDGTDEMGRAVAMGTYYYIIDLKEEEENEILKGAVTVLR